jgi:hypothetical protein
MAYDENNNGTSTEWWRWNGENWQPSISGSIYSSTTLYLYYDNMQSAIDGWGCDRMTASYIKVSEVDTGIKEVETASPVQIHSAGKTIHVNNATGKNGIITVYRIDGVKVAEQMMASQTTTIEIPAGGFYLVLVKAGDEKPVTAKVIVR